jgi:hypothetical protein
VAERIHAASVRLLSERAACFRAGSSRFDGLSGERLVPA